jgi:hypothetical protein
VGSGIASQAWFPETWGAGCFMVFAGGACFEDFIDKRPIEANTAPDQSWKMGTWTPETSQLCRASAQSNFRFGAVREPRKSGSS